MAEYLMLMHGDATSAEVLWDDYIGKLVAAGALRGGSALGGGACYRKSGVAAPLSKDITGFIRLDVASLAAAADLIAGNPTYEAGGTVEIRELVEEV